MSSISNETNDASLVLIPTRKSTGLKNKPLATFSVPLIPVMILLILFSFFKVLVKPHSGHGYNNSVQ